MNLTQNTNYKIAKFNFPFKYEQIIYENLMLINLKILSVTIHNNN